MTYSQVLRQSLIIKKIQEFFSVNVEYLRDSSDFLERMTLTSLVISQTILAFKTTLNY